MSRLRIFTWHVHGNYLYYLSRARHDFIVPKSPDGRHPYGGRGETFDFDNNVTEVPLADVQGLDFDLVLYQSAACYEDRFRVLSEKQLRLPAVYLEHDPPRATPTDTVHPVTDPNVLVVHVTNYNRLMWHNLGPTQVIEHGVVLPEGVRYRGDRARGLVAINDLATRGRRLGLDIFEEARKQVPLDLVGMHSDALGGLGEIPPMEFAHFAAQYRFFYSPIRHTSLGLAICEAMMIGLPVVALATAEMPSVIENGVNGYIATDPETLVPQMQHVIEHPQEAAHLGANARETALRRFGIERFVSDWDHVFQEAAPSAPPKLVGLGAVR